MASNTAETLIGAIVLAVAGGFLVYAANTADLGFDRGDGYRVVANFRKAEGLSVGGDVRIAGVKVGSVASMELNQKTYFARVTMSLDDGVEIPEDSVAKITSASLLGDNYVAIDPGASEFMVADGAELVNTQGSVSVGDLIGRFIHGQSSE